MVYVLSDVHGDYEKYQKMIDRIELDADKDTLYVLGDVLDGGDSMKILMDMSARPNVYPIIGEHEMRALPLLKKLAGEDFAAAVGKLAGDEKAKAAFAAWGKDGGEETLRAFRALDADDREWVIEYLEEFAPYEEAEVGGKEYLLVHAGLGNFAPDRDLDDYLLSELTMSEPDYERIYFPDKTLVTGHKPTVEINPAYKGKIFRLNGHIALDCGAEYGLPLGCIRLDDGKEFYVE